MPKIKKPGNSTLNYYKLFVLFPILTFKQVPLSVFQNMDIRLLSLSMKNHWPSVTTQLKLQEQKILKGQVTTTQCTFPFYFFIIFVSKHTASSKSNNDHLLSEPKTQHEPDLSAAFSVYSHPVNSDSDLEIEETEYSEWGIHAHEYCT